MLPLIEKKNFRSLWIHSSSNFEPQSKWKFSALHWISPTIAHIIAFIFVPSNSEINSMGELSRTAELMMFYLYNILYFVLHIYVSSILTNEPKPKAIGSENQYNNI